MPESINVNINAKLGNATQLERQVSNVARRAGKNFNLDLGARAADINKLSQPLGRITGQADEFTKSIEASNARVIAFGASVGVINAVVKSFQNLVAVTIDVEAQLSKINSILNVNSSQLDVFKGQIFDIARNTGQTFDTVAEAALELSRQGLSATEITKRLNDSLILARLSGLSAAESVAGLTAAVNSFSESGLTTSEVLNKISNAANQFAVSERDLIEGFKRSASVAQQAGVSIDELGGIITAVQQRTARGGAVIGNSFKTIFTRIGRAENLELLRSLGVEISRVEGGILPATKLIENLAKKLNELSDVEVRSVTEKIGGGFQIAPLLAALSDYNSESSIAVAATEAFANATDEAYKKNIILNQTLSAGINITRISIEELANALGELGVLDPFKELLSGLTGFIDGIRNVVQGINASDFFGPLFSGLSESLIKIGIAAFGAVLVVLSTRLAKFGVDSFKTFVGLNKGAKELEAAQQNIISSLLKDRDLREQILKINNSNLSEEQKRLKQTQEFTDALKIQLRSLQEIQKVAKNIAPGALNVARRAAGGSSNVGRSADGFLPIGAEKRDIQKGVGGAPRNAKPVIIEDFNFGGGKKGTMVANDSEFIVPNFAGGGDAIFNRNMAGSAGLPSGAKAINAAKGYIPNFVQEEDLSKFFNQDDPTRLSSNGTKTLKAGRLNLSDTEFEEGIRNLDSDIAQTARNNRAKALAIQKRLEQGGPVKKIGFFANANKGGGGFIMLVPEARGYDPDGADKRFNSPRKKASRKRLVDFFEGGTAGISSSIKKEKGKDGRDFSALIGLDEALTQGLEDGLKQAINGVTKLIEPDIEVGNISGKSIVDELEKGGAGAFGALRGAAFEKIISAAVGSLSDGGSELDINFDKGSDGKGRSKREALELIFNIPKNRFKRGDFKNSLNRNLTEKYITQVLDSPYKGVIGEEGALTGADIVGKKSPLTNAPAKKKKNASLGYVPNFAMTPLEDAIQRERQAGVPINQIRINQSGRLRNSQNPDGLAVTNTRDEPTGAIPQNAAKGFVPNFIGESTEARNERLKKQQETVGSSTESKNLEKAQKDGVASFLAISTAAFTAGTVLDNFAESTTGVVKNVAEFGSSLTGLVLTIQGLQQFGLDQKSLGREQTETIGQFSKRFGEQTTEKATKFFENQGVKGKQSRGLGKVLSLFGKFSGGLGKTVGFFSRLVPFIGPIITGFQGIAALGKLFGFDLVGTLGKGFTKLAEKIGLIDSPAEKAAKSLGDFSKSLNDSLLQGKGGQNILAQTGIQAVTEARKLELKSQGIDVSGKSDQEIRSEAFEKIARSSGGLQLDISGGLDENATKELAEVTNANITKQLLNFADDLTLSTADLTKQSEVKRIIEELRGGQFSSQIQEIESLSKSLFEAQKSGASGEEVKKIAIERKKVVDSILKAQKAERDAVEDIKKLRSDVLKIQIEESKKQNEILSTLRSRKEFELEIQRIALDGQKSKKIELDLELKRLQAQREGQKNLRNTLTEGILSDRRVKQVLEGDEQGKINIDKFKVILGTIEQINSLNIDASRFAEDYAQTLLKALTAITGNEEVAQNLVEKLTAQVSAQDKSLKLQIAAKELTERQNLVLKDQADIRKEILKAQEAEIRNQNEIVKARFDAATKDIDRGNRRLDVVFGGGEPPSVLEAIKSIRERDKESIGIQRKSFERLEKVQSDFLSIARDVGISDQGDVLSLIRSITDVDQSGQPTTTPERVNEIASALNKATEEQRKKTIEAADKAANRRDSILNQESTNAKTFETAIGKLLSFLDKSEKEKIKNSPEAKARASRFRDDAQRAALAQEAKRFEILDKKKRVENLEKGNIVANAGKLLPGLGQLPINNATSSLLDKERKELAKLEKEFESLKKVTEVYKKGLQETISIEEARSSLIAREIAQGSFGVSDQREAQKQGQEIALRVQKSKDALKEFDKVIKLFVGGVTREEKKLAASILGGETVRGGEANKTRSRDINFAEARGGSTLDRIQSLRVTEQKELEKLTEELDKARDAIAFFRQEASGGLTTTSAAPAGENTQSNVSQSSSIGRTVQGIATSMIDNFSRLNRASEELTTRISVLDSIINNTESTDTQIEKAKVEKEELEQKKKALQAQQNQNEEVNTVTESLKSFNGILDFIKKAFEKIKNAFRSFLGLRETPAEQPANALSPQQGQPFDSRTGERLQRQNQLDASTRDSFVSEQDQRRLAQFYQLELDLIESTSTAQRRKLAREFEDRQRILDLVLKVEDIESRSQNGQFTRDQLDEIQALRRQISTLKSKPDSVTDRIVDQIAVDEREAVQNVNDLLVKGAVDFRDTLVNGIEAAAVEGKDLKDTLRSAATEFLRELTRTNLKNAIGGITTLLTRGPNPLSSIDIAGSGGGFSGTGVGVPGATQGIQRGNNEQLPLFVQDVGSAGGSRSRAFIPPRAVDAGPDPDFVGNSAQTDPTSDIISKLTDGLKNIFNGFKNVFTNIFSSLKNVFSGIGGGIGSFVSGIFGFEGGGKVTGGSGSKDDVPAMLMGGEFVMKKDSVKKYGPQFMEAVNSGKLQKFAKGGIVDPTKIPKQKGVGNYFAPGLRGAGTISGAEALRGFASQGFTTGETDLIGADGGSNAAFINLEPESIRLTNFGRRANTPIQRATQDAKKQALGLAIEDDALRARLKAEEKQRKEEFKRAIISAVVSSVVSYGANVAASGFTNAANAYTASAGEAATTSGRVWEGVKGVFTGGTLEGGGAGQNYGGFANFFNSKGTVTQNRLADYFIKNPNDPAAIDFFKSGDIINNAGRYEFQPKSQQVRSIVEGVGSSAGKIKTNNTTLSSSVAEASTASVLEEAKGVQNLQALAQANKQNIADFGFELITGGGISGGISKTLQSILKKILEERRRASLPIDDGQNLLPQRFATGGMVRDLAGVDTVPAMLSGGEFVLNSSAASRIGEPALNRLNSGEETQTNNGADQEEVVTKLDELIKTTKESTGDISITVNGNNGTSSEESSSEAGSEEKEGSNMRLAKLIKTEVLKIINDEKRLGGTLRRGV